MNGKERKNIISAKDIVKRFGISYHTVNYYTAIGLLSIVGKSGNQRVYDGKDVRRRMVKISHLIKEGYSLHLIRKKIVGV
ncbi:MAG: MerR family transcriptional regulator [Candidatus Omnitrophota bacterium]